jgi:hypothetical protein
MTSRWRPGSGSASSLRHPLRRSRTAVLGATLLTGYLGGAVATQVRVGDPWFLFPAVMGALAWVGPWCQSPQMRELLPLVR